MGNDPNEMVQLRTGAAAPRSAVLTTMVALRHLAGSGDITDVMALYEVRELAGDPQHQLWPGTRERLEPLLTPDGGLHEITRDVILAAVEGGDAPRLVSPVREEVRPDA